MTQVNPFLSFAQVKKSIIKWNKTAVEMQRSRVSWQVKMWKVQIKGRLWISFCSREVLKIVVPAHSKHDATPFMTNLRYPVDGQLRNRIHHFNQGCFYFLCLFQSEYKDIKDSWALIFMCLVSILTILFPFFLWVKRMGKNWRSDNEFRILFPFQVIDQDKTLEFSMKCCYYRNLHELEERIPPGAWIPVSSISS